MPQLAAQVSDYSLALGFYPGFCPNDEAVTSQIYEVDLHAAFKEIYRSAFWQSKAHFAEARRRLRNTATLPSGWDTYDAEAPNDLARAITEKVLDALEADMLSPTRLMPSSEGGVAITFVEGDNRALIEIYNNGEIAAATYSSDSEPLAWELGDTDSALKNAIEDIRVRLAA